MAAGNTGSITINDSGTNASSIKIGVLAVGGGGGGGNIVEEEDPSNLNKRQAGDGGNGGEVKLTEYDIDAYSSHQFDISQVGIGGNTDDIGRGDGETTGDSGGDTIYIYNSSNTTTSAGGTGGERSDSTSDTAYGGEGGISQYSSDLVGNTVGIAINETTTSQPTAGANISIFGGLLNTSTAATTLAETFNFNPSSTNNITFGCGGGGGSASGNNPDGASGGTFLGSSAGGTGGVRNDEADGDGSGNGEEPPDNAWGCGGGGGGRKKDANIESQGGAGSHGIFIIRIPLQDDNGLDVEFNIT